jgi:hypothetical protein
MEKKPENTDRKKKWKSVSDVLPENIGVLKTSEHRYLKLILRFAQLLNQPVDTRCTRLTVPRTARKPGGELLTDGEVRDLLTRAEAYCHSLAVAGHLVATMGIGQNFW